MTYEKWKSLFTPTDTDSPINNYQFTYSVGDYTIGVLLGDVFINDELIESFPYKNEKLMITKSKYDIYKGREYNIFYDDQKLSFFVNAELTHVTPERKTYLKKLFNFAMKR